MKQILVLRTNTTSDQLVQELSNYANTEATYTQSDYSNIYIQIDENNISLTVDGVDLKEYDLVYFKSWDKARIEALCVATYAKYNNIKFVDKLPLLTPTSNKIYQTLKLGLEGFTVPKSLFVSNLQNISYDEVCKNIGSHTFIMKAISAREGNHNYKVDSEQMFGDILSESLDTKFIFQEFIPNSFDFRIGVMGTDVAYIKKRIRQNTHSHLNNVAMGSMVEILDPKDSTLQDVCTKSIRASEILGISVAGVDIVQSDIDRNYYILEINRSPAFKNDYSVVQYLHKYFIKLLKA